ncbi:MAG: cytochrome o ubiquinol oxidase subunit IV [Steroidobacteraceae bacterium]
MNAAHEQAHDQPSEAGHFTLRTYLTGFLVATVLTAVPFWIVMGRPIASAEVSAVVVVVLAVAQIFVHTFAFLHVNSRAQGGWTLVAYVFTAVLVLILIGGSVWIMLHLNANMMPGMTGGSKSRIP